MPDTPEEKLSIYPRLHPEAAVISEKPDGKMLIGFVRVQNKGIACYLSK
jgi:hypothetical protein